MIDRILVPLDGSTLAECTVPHAMKLARAFDSRIVLLSVTEPDPAGDDSNSYQWRMARAETHGYLGRIEAIFEEGGVAVESRVLEGRAAERILDAARETRADLILLSSHGRGGMTEFPLSGTAGKVLTAANTSVMVVRPEEFAPRAAGAPSGADVTPYGSVVAPVDCTKRSAWSARLAAAIARAEGGELVLVTVVPAPEVLGEAPTWSEAPKLARRLAALNRERAERYLEALQNELGGPELRVRSRLVQDPHIVPALEKVALEEDASLLVVCAHGRSADNGFPHGTVASRLLERATRPLIVFQDVGTPQPAPGPRTAARGARRGARKG